jgi:hypothetical protein
MPRRNQPDPSRRRQHAKAKKRPRGWHRKSWSPGMRQAAAWLQEAA